MTDPNQVTSTDSFHDQVDLEYVIDCQQPDVRLFQLQTSLVETDFMQGEFSSFLTIIHFLSFQSLEKYLKD